MRVVHLGTDAVAQASELTAAYEQDPNVDGLLVDSRTAAAAGGTGVVYDWELAAKTVFQNARERRLVVAGGLTPENVGGAIAALRPWGVDVVSGVEAEPGRKDPLKVREFVKREGVAADLNLAR